MNPILNDELVRRYFQCGPHPCGDHNCDEVTALRVLDAMCSPIKKGEKYLGLGWGKAMYCEAGSPIASPHITFLRLPDSHQEPDYEKELYDLVHRFLGPSTRVTIHEIVDLARKAERQKMEREKR